MLHCRHLELFDHDRDDVRNETDRECLPYASFNDIVSDSGYSNILMNPVNVFFNKTEEIIKPVRDVVSGMRKQLLLDVQVGRMGLLELLMKMSETHSH